MLEIVGERIFNHKFIESLLCKKTCLNKCEKGHVFSSLQVTKKILGSEHVTIHSDGTSRDHKKIADHQISLDGAACLYVTIHSDGTSRDHKKIADHQISLDGAACLYVTIHSDGTSRDHKKIADHQISLDGAACLYLGFAPLASEDAQALLDLTINILKELSAFNDETDPIFKSLLSKINSTVTDRAASMKLYDQKLLEFMKSE